MWTYMTKMTKNMKLLELKQQLTKFSKCNLHKKKKLVWLFYFILVNRGYGQTNGDKTYELIGSNWQKWNLKNQKTID